MTVIMNSDSSSKEEISPSNADLMKAILQINSTLSNQMSELNKTMTEGQQKLEEKNSQLQIHLQSHDRKFDIAYKRDTKKNLVIYGWSAVLSKPIHIIREMCLELLVNKLNLEGVRLYDIHEIKVNGIKKNVVIVTLCSPCLVRLAISNAHRLKGSKIFLVYDMPPEERAVKKELLAYMRNLKSKGKDCKIKKNLLVIGDQSLTLNQVKTQFGELPDDSQRQQNVNQAIQAGGSSSNSMQHTSDVVMDVVSDVKKRTPPPVEKPPESKKILRQPSFSVPQNQNDKT